MTATTERKPAPTQSTPDTNPTANLTAVLAAFNAANLASNYIERGNFTAARRKLVQALASSQLAVETVATQGNKKLIGLDGPGVGADRLEEHIAAHRGAVGRQCGFLKIHHDRAPWALFQASRAARVCSTSEKGWRTPLISW